MTQIPSLQDEEQNRDGAAGEESKKDEFGFACDQAKVYPSACASMPNVQNNVIP